MYTLVAFATQWGSKHGGINSFNADFLTAFGVAYHQNAQIVCIVSEASVESIEEAARAHVTLVPLPYVPVVKSFDISIGEIGVELITKSAIKLDPDQTVWLGHDLITGEAAIAAARKAGGRAAVIHHMSYSDYESYAEDSQSALAKTQRQTTILEKADLVLAIGPLLRDAAIDRLGATKTVRMLIPGLPEIDPQETPKTFVAFLSGRLSADAARIKQGHLGVAAFAAAERKARIDGVPDALRKQPKLLLRGVDFENKLADFSPGDVETNLKKFAEQYAEAVINLHALPFTENRQQLYLELSRSTVALMPSWHEGFGLVAWEAMAAGVPVIIGQNSGVYRYLEEEYPGAETGYVHSVDIKGQIDFPYFRKDDLDATVDALRNVAADPSKARKKASTLRNLLLEKNTWVSCCEDTAAAFGWDVQRGSLGERSGVILQQFTEPAATQAPAAAVHTELLRIPQRQWRAGTGMADSQLLRAEEALLPFDPGREGDVEELRKWINDPALPITVRLITGKGGQGKTRLAIHICEQARTSGWYAGFLDTNLEPGRMHSLWTDLRALNQPILVVVDYAETRQAAFLSLLKLARQSPMDQPLRMLLLARDSGEWWENLPSRDPACEALLIGSATSGPFRLAALYTTQLERQAAFIKALHAFADILQIETPDITTDLSGDQFERPLFVQMAALLALYGERPITSQGLTKALLNHERRYWERLLEPLNWPDPGRRAEQLLALATLAGGFPTSRAAETFWKAAKEGVLSTGEFNALFRSMATLYPGDQGLQALRPDLLGEALVAQALLRPEGDVLLDSVLSSSAPQATRRQALTVISRLSNERVDVDEVLVAGLVRQLQNCGAEVVVVSTETASRLPDLAGLAFEQLSSTIKSQVAGSLSKSLPEQSVQLASLSCLVFGYEAQKAGERLARKLGHTDRLFDYAVALSRYSIYLAYAGNYSKACEMGEESVNVLRRLASRNRNQFEINYAAALGNYANRLDENGRFAEEAEIIRESLESYERLYKQNPNRFARDFATLLDNYASLLADLGQIDEALSRAQSSLEIYKQVVLKIPYHFEGDYARALGNYANHLAEAGKYEESLDYSGQALEIRRRLALRTPDRFEPDYAFSLHTHASSLSNVGKYRESLANAIEGLQIHQRLVQRIPRAFARQFLITTAFAGFLNWLCHSDDHKFPTLDPNVLSWAPEHEYDLIRQFFHFVEGCQTTDLEARKTCFGSVLAIWPSLSPRDSRLLEPHRLCAAAWYCKFVPDAENSWLDDWQRYLAKRHGNIQAPMLEVARRLDFEFPKQSPTSIVS